MCARLSIFSDYQKAPQFYFKIGIRNNCNCKLRKYFSFFKNQSIKVNDKQRVNGFVEWKRFSDHEHPRTARKMNESENKRSSSSRHVLINIFQTRKHSSRMRTVRCSGRLLVGECLPWGMSAQGGVCTGGVFARGCIPACTGVDTPRGQNS